ncbi:MAG: hypothetical protein ACREV6_07025 [Clostridium sp.]|uniref:hypothetical protein n=1 Tax=Clostridium sp. TaxID=1506 RepID=UPI003D6C7C24
MAIEVLKIRDTFKLIKISETTYEIKDGDELVLKMEGTYTEKDLEEQFNNIGKGCVII